MTKPAKHKQSAGLLVFRRKTDALEVFLVHMGGPFWTHKDEGAWSIPKGEFGEEEAAFAAAQREFHEETGFTPAGEFLELGPVKQAGGKTVYAWALEWDCDAAQSRSNTFRMEWPKGSGVLCDFPEVDRAEWFPLEVARQKILKGQLPLLDQLQARLIGP